MTDKEFECGLHITEENFLDNVDKLIKIIKNSPEYLKLADCTQMIFDKKGKNRVNNRQTHTNSVASLALKLAQKFRMSKMEQKLAELIGLCHDLGHTAFGHTGESRIDKVLLYYDIPAKEFNDAYSKQNNMPELLIQHGYKETDHSFEHHAHSRRVIRKILKDNDVIIDSNILSDLEWGILCHSESRVKDDKVTKILWTLARYADKFYAFTDVYDTIKSENYIPGDILYRIKNEGNIENYFKEGFNLEQKDFEQFSAILGVFEQGDAISYFVQKYIEEAQIVEDNGHYCIETETEIGRQMRLLQGVMRYMREKGFVGKEEKLANAMIDEIIAYKIHYANNEILDHKDKVINACLFVSMSTDTELRDFYRVISKNKEWIEFFDEKMKNNKEFETEVEQEEREYIRNNPDIILNYYFNTEIDKVNDLDIRTKLYGKLIEYRTKPTLKLRRKLIEQIEFAQSGGDPFTKGR